MADSAEAQAGFRKRSVGQQVAEQLVAMIREAEWEVGEQLPSTRELATRFGVSLNSAQKGLQVLAEQGLVEMRPRAGSFIKALPRSIDSPPRLAQIGVIWRAGVREDAHHRLEQESWAARIVRAFEHELLHGGFHLVTCPFNATQPDALAAELVPRLDGLGDPLKGVLCFGSANLRPLLTELDGRGLPWVTVNPPARDSVYNFVAADNIGGGRRLGLWLAQMGVRRTLVLSTPLAWSQSNRGKLLGIYEGFLETGQPTDGIRVEIAADENESSGYDAARACLDRTDEPPQVIATTGDFLAIGAIRACRERGLRVPEDVGVIGATGLLSSACSRPPLTVLEQPMEEMGRQAALMLIEMAREGVRRMVGRRIPGPITFRDSIAAPTEIRQMLEAEYRASVNRVTVLTGQDDL